jgi:methylase of polypeptide subunit release factors
VSIQPGQLLPSAGRLRALFRETGYTVDGVDAALGPLATAAMGRGDPVPALAAASGDDPLHVCIRLFLLGTDEPAPIAAFLPPPALEACGSGRVRAALDLRPHEDDWWLAADIARRHPPAADHVIGIGAASTTLLAATLRQDVASALDVGTGGGIQALHLLRHSRSVTATDALPRAIDMARLSFALSGLRPDAVELLCGDLLAPVSGRQFDLVVSNPPFVLAPSGDDPLTYRDAAGADGGLARLLRDAAAALTSGGVAQVLTSWVIDASGDWQSRPAAMLPPGCDALVLLREVLDPAEHVALWRDDDEPEPQATARSLRWLAHVASLGADGIAYGLVVLRRTEAEPRIRLLDLRAEGGSPNGARIGGWLGRVSDVRDLSRARLAVTADARLDEESGRGPDGWEVSSRRVVSAAALPETVGIDPITSALLAGCDGRLPLETVAELLAVASGVDPAQILRVAAHLYETGHLAFASP